MRLAMFNVVLFSRCKSILSAIVFLIEHYTNIIYIKDDFIF